MGGFITKMRTRVWAGLCAAILIVMASGIAVKAEGEETKELPFPNAVEVTETTFPDAQIRKAIRDYVYVDDDCKVYINPEDVEYLFFEDEVADINNREDIDFVIHCGDLTDTGTTKEFEWSRDILTGLRYPFVALVGNHDFLGVGDQTYCVMYGSMDFSFIANRVKFVCLNTNATEYDYMAAVPNFDYMEEEIIKDSANFDRTIVVMHAPPYSDQFNNNVCKAFRSYLDFFPGLMCCVYGHNHNDKVDDIYEDGLIFYGIDCALHRNYRIMTITPDGYEMEQIYY